MKTHTSKPTGVSRSWYLLDASKVSLGRLATTVSRLLMGKDKTDFSPHLDGGDYVVIVNAQKLKVTGGKMTDKKYFRHSGYPSGLTTETLAEVLSKNPSRAIHQAVRGMLPSNKLRPQRLARLKVYAGSEHSHSAQKPTEVQLVKSGR
ncbi:50S ribosomal protein L13 [Candidatus Saccharibacteria bacterium RIFCSPHIGHO2_12_FULL_49_19]|nr:MAG: 50S ribosomal protein L13 [Candidatus Saccharibacteria bacterium RIFCSPHIGHO2_01_FULL_49_21]OGL37776.1 MAG: 50S ribosomal protein L13 [Candidatus Saccharibacteria bacterium RIFCSPHIGHO2_12_FULL_49_19]OGL38567.1 MAG: 50S ribosomal protein L13 [Candidatus Saccharibacteria bacterium RIFCSPLOWO2_01_FULL_49_22]